MKWINIRADDETLEVVDDLERQCRRLFPDVESRTDAIKKGLRIALSYIKSTPFYEPSRDTEPVPQEIDPKEKTIVTRISSSEINLDGSRKS